MGLISKKSSLSDSFQKQRASFIKDEEFNKIFFLSEPRKSVKLKPFKSFKARERYQADIILFLNIVWD